MYTNHFSLQSLPFENTPDPAYFFNQGDYSRVFTRMIDSLRAERGLMVVAGPIGTGKTTLCQKLMSSVSEKTRIIWMGEPPDTSEDLLLFLTQEFHINPGSSSRIFVLRDIKEYLLKLHNAGNRCMLIIDEVQKISDDALECIRLLNNLEQGSIKLIQMLLLGQEEFLVKLSRPELESFKQRIAWLETIGKMTSLQTHQYILHRLKIAGSQSRIFTADAMEAIIVATRGTPRLVNTFCDRALHVSFESNKTIVDLSSVRRAADAIGLGTEVFLCLKNLDRKTAKIAEQETSSIKDNPSPATSNPNKGEPAPFDKNRSVNTHRDISQSHVFTSMDELFDITVGKLSKNPIMQLFISILLCSVSVYFFITNLRM
jgi:general secretion pathway protein A